MIAAPTHPSTPRQSAVDRLPAELWSRVLQLGALPPEQLARCALTLSRAPNALAQAACAPPLWQPWLPRRALERAAATPDPQALPKAFLARQRGYPAPMRAALARCRAAPWRPLPADPAWLVRRPDGGLDLCYFHVAQMMAERARLPALTVGAEPSAANFDAAVALLAYASPLVRLEWAHVPRAFWHEPAFAARAVQFDLGHYARLTPRLRAEPLVRHSAVDAALDALARGEAPWARAPEQHATLRAELFDDRAFVAGALRLDPTLWPQVSRALRHDVALRRLADAARSRRPTTAPPPEGEALPFDGGLGTAPLVLPFAGFEPWKVTLTVATVG